MHTSTLPPARWIAWILILSTIGAAPASLADEADAVTSGRALEKALELREADLATAGIAVRTNLAPDLPRTMNDFDKLQQVFVNLITNAEQAMSLAGLRGTLTVSTRLVEGSLEASVVDEGPGIAPEVLPKIFEPFFTTKPVGSGTGLGLSICYGILEEHGGTIRAENVPTGGARFTVVLPVREPAAPTAPTPIGAPRTGAEAAASAVQIAETAMAARGNGDGAPATPRQAASTAALPAGSSQIGSGSHADETGAPAAARPAAAPAGPSLRISSWTTSRSSWTSSTKRSGRQPTAW